MELERLLALSVIECQNNMVKIFFVKGATADGLGTAVPEGHGGR